MCTRALFVLFALQLGTTPAWAHHAKDYLVTGGYDTLHQGKTLVYVMNETSFEELSDSDSYEGEITPGFMYGLTDTWQVETHTHLRYPNAVRPEGGREDLFVESFAPSIKYRVPEHDDWPMQFAVAIELELPTGDGKRKAGTEYQLRPHVILHREWAPNLESVLDLEERVELTGSQHAEWGLSFGTKLTLTSSMAAGLEFQIPADAPGARFVPGLYLRDITESASKSGLASA